MLVKYIRCWGMTKGELIYLSTLNTNPRDTLSDTNKLFSKEQGDQLELDRLIVLKESEYIKLVENCGYNYSHGKEQPNG